MEKLVYEYSKENKVNELKELINSNPSINLEYKELYGNTALYWAVQKGNQDIAKLLIVKSKFSAYKCKTIINVI